MTAGRAERILVLAAVGDYERVMDQVSSALTSSSSDRERIEQTLMDGYAQAHSLEGERLRAQKRVSALAATMDQGDKTKKAKELSQLAQQIELQDELLADLRRQLARLRAEYSAT